MNTCFIILSDCFSHFLPISISMTTNKANYLSFNLFLSLPPTYLFLLSSSPLSFLAYHSLLHPLVAIFFLPTSPFFPTSLSFSSSLILPCIYLSVHQYWYLTNWVQSYQSEHAEDASIMSLRWRNQNHVVLEKVWMSAMRVKSN